MLTVDRALGRLAHFDPHLRHNLHSAQREWHSLALLGLCVCAAAVERSETLVPLGCLSRRHEQSSSSCRGNSSRVRSSILRLRRRHGDRGRLRRDGMHRVDGGQCALRNRLQGSGRGCDRLLRVSLRLPPLPLRRARRREAPGSPRRLAAGSALPSGGPLGAEARGPPIEAPITWSMHMTGTKGYLRSCGH